MAAIPPISTTSPQGPAPVDRLADARAAFFRQALASAAGPAAQAVRAAPVAAAPAVARTAPAAPAFDPDRPMRPGSIINIRV